MSAYLKRLMELAEKATPGPLIAANYGKRTFGVGHPGNSATMLIRPGVYMSKDELIPELEFLIALRNPDFLEYVAALEEFYEMQGAVTLHDQSLSGASRRYERKSQATTSVESARQKLEGEDI